MVIHRHGDEVIVEGYVDLTSTNFDKKYRDRISPPKTMLMLRDNAICRKVS